jgi:homoserine kinase type II
MAVYTDISETELAAFLTEYDIGELRSYRGIAEGSENSNYVLHTSGGEYILTLYEKRVERADLPFFLGLMQHLANKGISCPLPVERRDGELISAIAGRPAAIITFLEGFWVRRPTSAHCREVGKALADLHLAGQDFPLRRANSMSMAGAKKLWLGSRDRADEVEPGLETEIEADFAKLAAEWPKELPEGVIHADLFPDNVFFLDGELSGLIDFYFACNDFLAYDLATCLNAWCFEKDHSFNLTKGRALLAGYQSVRPLGAGERDALPVLALGSALRFLMTRLYDWLHVPDGAMVQKRDPKELLRRVRFHRAIGSASEYGLDA